MKKCDIIIPVWNELESTRRCIKLLKDNTRYPYRLIVVDNGSQEATRAYLDGLKEHFPGYLLIRNNTNSGFVKAVNQGITSSSGQYLCLLNNDAYVRGGWLTSLIETLEEGPKEIGIANPTSNVFGKDSPDGKNGEFQELDSGRGFCMLIKREVVEKIGLFDEIYRMGYFEEKDFSRRAIKAGYISVRSKASYVEHRDRLSFDKLGNRDEIFKRNENIYNKKWGKPINIAFVNPDEPDIKEKQNAVNSFLKKGHYLYIFSKKKRDFPAFKDHVNIKYFPVGKLFFNYIVLSKLWKRRRKKKIEIIIIDDKNTLVFFNKFKFVHAARLLSREECVAEEI